MSGYEGDKFLLRKVIQDIVTISVLSVRVRGAEPKEINSSCLQSRCYTVGLMMSTVCF